MNDQQKIIQVSQLQDINDIAVGGFHSIAIAANGLWIWGKADMCNLGFSSKFPFISTPKYIQIDISSACGGNQHSFVWKNNEVYCWGSNKDYKLGFQNPGQYSLTKSLIFQEAIGAGMELDQICCGDSHSLACFKLEEETGVSYQIFAWGQSKSYQLALEAEGSVSEPILIDFNQTVRNVYSRSDYNFIVTEGGDCFSWGTNLFGRLGFQNSINNQKFPTQVKFLTKIRSISMGKYHCIAINENFEAFCWGHGVQGQLGLNKIVSETTPTKIEFQQKVIQSACGQYHSVILTDKHELYSCGSNSYFALGHQEVDEKKRCKKFVKIKIDQNIKISKILSGNRHNILLTYNGKVYSWGCNKYGQLGRLEIESKDVNLKKELYKQDNLMKKNIEMTFKDRQRVNPFLQIREFSPKIKKEQTKSLQQKIVLWRQKYENFKKEKEKEEKKLLNQLQQILKYGK